MKQLLWTLIVLCSWCNGITQVLSLEDAQQLARINYPLTNQKNLLEKTGQYTLENISKGKLPQLNLSGQATYQSEVTEIPIKIPNQNIPVISKDQYRLYAEVVQPISDIATVRQQEKVQKAINQNALDRLEVDLYQLNERISNLFFGILLLDEQKKINQLAKLDLQTGINKVTAAINNGTDYRSSLDKLNAEVLRLDEKDIELYADRRALLQMLLQFIGKQFSDSVKLKIPADITADLIIKRPELKMFESQEAIYNAQQQLLHSKIMPKLSLFVQAGVGRPALNMLRNDLRPYYIAGIRMNWNISNFYTYRNENKILEVSKEMTDVQKQTFLFNTQLTLQQQTAEVKKYDDLLQTDENILTLRATIKKTAITQLENGVITVNDYLKEVFNEQSAGEQQQLHKLQRLQAQYNIKTTRGI